MPKVLILGATGYLGKRLAETLVRSGQHRVYGIARSEAKAKTLALAEVTPIICPDPVNEPKAYTDAVRHHRIEVIVDVAGAYQETAKFLSHAKEIGQERLDSYAAAGIGGPKLGFIYCSGTWVHGSSNTPLTDLDIVGPTAVTPPRALVSWRVGLENSILSTSDVLDVAILRPALIYGHEHTIWTPFILPLLEAARSSSESINVPLEADSRPALIHVDDVATGFQKAIENLSLISNGSTYPVFDLLTSQESMSEIFAAMASSWGFKGKWALVGSGDNSFAEAMSTTLRGSPSRAKQLLGWEPTRLNGFVADMDIYAAAFASQH